MDTRLQKRKAVHRRLKMTPSELLAYCVLKAISYHAVNGERGPKLLPETKAEHTLLLKKLHVLQRAMRSDVRAIQAKRLLDKEIMELWGSSK